ncbi:hypothetical protein BVRB_8g187800 [Beta vulgaris subsp. vulgaris]|nr:hypothetical protein BVRB_8g187800 [Beta vulgaris subsp. vulgaris]
MNDLVFVMYNLRLKKKQQQQPVIQETIVLDDLPSDDEWITERDEPLLPHDETWLNVLDRAARRYAREEAQRENERGDQADNIEIHELSDGEIDGQVTPTAHGSNDIEDGDLDMTFGDDDIGDEEQNTTQYQMRTRSSGANIVNDGVDDANFGYDD